MPLDVFGSNHIQKTNQLHSNRTTNHREIIPLTRWTKHSLSYLFERNPDFIRSRNIRFVDDPFFDNKLSIIMQGNRTYISCANKDEMYGLIIKSQNLTNTLTSIFELQWQLAIPITKDILKNWQPSHRRKLPSRI